MHGIADDSLGVQHRQRANLHFSHHVDGRYAGGVRSDQWLTFRTCVVSAVEVGCFDHRDGECPMTLADVGNASYRSCIAPCMTTITLRDSSNVAVDDRTSSVFYDYKNDNIWVGGALGWVHKFTGVFNGTPAAVTTGGFPVQVANSLWTSSAVYDRVSNNVFVGDSGGFVYAINASTGAVTASGQLDFGAGVVDAPIIDQTGGFLYVFVSADNASGLCPGLGNCAAVYQLSTTFASSDTGTEVGVGDSSATPTPMYIGGFDSPYYSSANRTGNLYVCGNNGFNATLYQVPIAAGALPLSGQGTAMSALATGAAGCSSVTDVPNPNTAIGPAERIFVSVQNHGRYTGCGGGGCLFNFVNAEWKPSTTYVRGQQILSARLHVETVISSGGTQRLLRDSRVCAARAPILREAQDECDHDS
jgi:hypothetical protein